MTTRNDGRLVRCMTALLTEPWLLTPQMHRELTRIVRAHAFGGETEQAQHKAAAEMPANPAKRQYMLMDRTAVLPVEGVIGRKFSAMLQESGVVSVDVLERLVRTAASDDVVQSIVMVFDSPGGYSLGVAECAAAIRAARDVKPVLAYVDGACHSAAYWLASQSEGIYVWSGSSVGSIGAYAAFLDESRAMEMEGYRLELFKSGSEKAMGMPGTSLTDSQRADIQARVDAIGARFRADVQAGRGRAIRDEDMQGQAFDVGPALAAGLIDDVTDWATVMRDAADLARQRATRKELTR